MKLVNLDPGGINRELLSGNVGVADDASRDNPFRVIRSDWLFLDIGFRHGSCQDLPVVLRSARLPRSSVLFFLWG